MDKLINAGLKQRSMTALIAIPLALGIIYIGGQWFTVVAGIAAVIMLAEWLHITHTARPKFIWIMSGLLYTFVPCILLVKLRYFQEGMALVFTVFALVWATDIGGYLFGRMIGGPKLAPRISPNKTWAGLVGAALSAAVVTYLAARIASGEWYLSALYLGAILAVIAQMGDLCESGVKRRFGVKDSGTIIPGHGGLLDRLDGLLIVIPVVWLMEGFFWLS